MVSTDQKLEERAGARLNARPRGSTCSGSGYPVCELAGLDRGRGVRPPWLRVSKGTQFAKASREVFSASSTPPRRRNS